ncbi:MAG: hypothetical protein RIE52_12540 [Balneola sp.]|jgi:hypothetical protein
MKFFENSFYIKACKDKFFVKSFINGNWIQCNTEFELNENYKVVRLNKLESSLKELKIDRTQTTTSKFNPFNHPRVIIHEFEALEIFTRFLLKNLTFEFWRKAKTFIFQLDYEPIGGITDIEIRAIRDYLEHLGAQKIYIVNPKYNSISFEKIEHFYKQTQKRSNKIYLNSEFGDIFWA